MKIDISYIASCYNSERFLDGLIENLLQQSHTNFELIIVDSNSTDNSVEIIRGWQEKDDRIKLVEQPSRTPYGISWLIGWRRAEGKVICNTNTDDRSYPWRGMQIMRADQAQMFRSDRRFYFYYGGYETRIDDKVVAKGIPPPYTEDDMSQFFRCGIHVHWNEALELKVEWDRMFRAGREYKSAFDYWLVLYFMSLGAVGIPISSCFSIYNQRADSLEQSDKELSCFEAMRAINEFYPGGKAMWDLETKTQYESPEFYKRFKEFMHGYGE